MIVDLAWEADYDRKYVREEPYVEGTPTEGGPYEVRCSADSCTASLPAKLTELMAILVATAAGWEMRRKLRKLSGYAYEDFCPNCKGKA